MDPCDLAKDVQFQAEYDDGSTDVFAVPEATLLQGGVPAVLPIIAWEWQARRLFETRDHRRRAAEEVCVELSRIWFKNGA